MRSNILLRIVTLGVVASLCAANLFVILPFDKADELNGDGSGTKYELLQFAQFQWNSFILGGVRFLDVPDCHHLKNLTANFSKQLTTHTNMVMIKLPEKHCSLSTYAKYVQNTGAKMLIFISPDPNHKMTKITWISSSTDTPNLIHIPVIMIPYDVGQKFIEIVKDDKPDEDSSLYVQYQQVPPLTPSVKLILWLDAGAPNCYDALETVQEALQDVRNITDFEPKYLNFQSPDYKDIIDGNLDCIESTLHCLKNEDAVLRGRVSLHEAIRSTCIYKNFRGNWWEYVTTFGKTCVKEGATVEATNTCSHEVMKKAHILPNSIDNCYGYTFPQGENYTNTFLNENFNFNNKRVLQAPALLINDFLYEDVMEASEILDEICRHWIGADESKICTDVRTTIKHKKYWHAIWYILAALLLFSIIFFVVYRMAIRRQIQEEMADQVGTAVTMYLKFGELSMKKKAVAEMTKVSKKPAYSKLQTTWRNK
eukprot:TRINITY_DN13464_c0_g1_i1.p1 TRINITY_DN13464_c0_g1~~TRINITY_DN13464_c0_g1_i1.p1  ORF type:complete len:482 (-),score=43.83 TRINITY_DN13464_c0_g1_i1:271-1716(-)